MVRTVTVPNTGYLNRTVRTQKTQLLTDPVFDSNSGNGGDSPVARSRSINTYCSRMYISFRFRCTVQPDLASSRMYIHCLQPDYFLLFLQPSALQLVSRPRGGKRIATTLFPRLVIKVVDLLHFTRKSMVIL